MSTYRYKIVFCLILSVAGCEYSELWQHRQETGEIQTRLPQKERYLDGLKNETNSLERQGAELRSNIHARQAALDQLEQKSLELEIRLDEARVRNKKLSYDIGIMKARSKSLIRRISDLRERQSEPGGHFGQTEQAQLQQVEQLQDELDMLLKIIAKQK